MSLTRDLGLAGDPSASTPGGERPLPIWGRALRGASGGLLGGLIAGTVLGLADAGVTLALAGPGEDTQVLLYAVVLYGLVLAAIGIGIGGTLSLLPLPQRIVDRWMAPLALFASMLPLGLAVSLFRLQRDAYGEQQPPIGVAFEVAAAVTLVTVLLTALLAWAFRERAGRRAAVARRIAWGAATWLAVVLSAAGVSHALQPAAPTARPVRTELSEGLRGRPNVLLLIVDTLRADHLGAYGDKRNLTPNLDAFARDATVFQAYGQSSWTKPSIATILTSLYASSHRAMAKAAILPESAITIAQVMRENGFTTAGFVSNINLAPSFNFDRGFDEYHYLAPDYLLGAEESSSKLVMYSILRKVILTLNRRRWVNQYYQDSRTVNAAAINWLERNRADRFFLLMHYMDPHDPYFRHPYDGFAIARVENPNPSPALAAIMRDLYAGEVRYMDESFGELIAFLRRSGLYDQMAIVVVADHGEEFQEHGGWWHGTTLYDEQIHVPFMVKLPEATPALEPSTGQARLIDLAPTIAGFAGVSAPSTWQGADLRFGVPLDRPVFAEEDYEGNVLSAIRTPERKLIRANPGNPRGLKPNELYDVGNDPGETRDLESTAPGIVVQLSNALMSLGKIASEEAAGSAEEVEMDSQTKERLRALGYAK